MTPGNSVLTAPESVVVSLSRRAVRALVALWHALGGSQSAPAVIYRADLWLPAPDPSEGKADVTSFALSLMTWFDPRYSRVRKGQLYL